MLSSARVVRCWVKSRNERNPLSCHHLVGHSERTASDKLEEGGDDVNPHGPYVLGYTRATMVSTTGKQDGDVKQILKRYLSSGLHSATRVHEAGITSNRGSACHGECSRVLYTPPVTHGSWFYLKARFNTLDHGIVSDWGEVVTR